ncbi:hypothetical protein Tco_0148967 [Tanacetum coccineum]
MDASGGSEKTPSSDGTTTEDIAEFEVASKSTSSISKPKKVTTHKVVTQKVQTKAFPVKSPVPIKNCILGLAAAHTWACTGNKTFGTRKQKDAIVAGQARKGKKKQRRKIHILDPPAGIFANHLTSLFECDFVSLDSRLNSKSTMDHSFGSAEEVDHVRILQSCNGLLLCSGSAWPLFYYVYNPSINLKGFRNQITTCVMIHVFSAVVYLDWPLILENQVTTKWCKLEAKLVRLGFKFTLQRQGIGASVETDSATLVLIILKVQPIGIPLAKGVE